MLKLIVKTLNEKMFIYPETDSIYYPNEISQVNELYFLDDNTNKIIYDCNYNYDNIMLKSSCLDEIIQDFNFLYQINKDFVQCLITCFEAEDISFLEIYRNYVTYPYYTIVDVYEFYLPNLTTEEVGKLMFAEYEGYVSDLAKECIDYTKYFIKITDGLRIFYNKYGMLIEKE